MRAASSFAERNATSTMFILPARDPGSETAHYVATTITAATVAGSGAVSSLGVMMARSARGHSMNMKTAEVVICGAGIAGIAAAYHLAVRRGMTDVVLVDERPPLTLTSDKSAECYRNWWPGPGDVMVAAMNRSVDLLEDLARESGNVF